MNAKLFSYRLLFATLNITYLQSAFAHEIDDALPTVVVKATRADLLGIANSSSEGEAGAKQIATRPLLRPGEVLELVPGLIATQHSGDGKANQYFLRGFNLDHGTDFATFMDGMPVNLRTHAHGQGYTDLNFLIPELVQKVQYRKGPYAVDDGDFASAGSARITTYNRVLQPFLQTELGANRFGRIVGAGSTELSSIGTLLFAGEAQHANGPWEVPEGYGKKNALLRLSKNTGHEQWAISAMAYQARWTSTDQIAQRAVDQGLIGRFGSLDRSTGGQSSRYSLSGNWSHKTEAGKLSVNGYAIKYGLDLYSNFSYFSRGCEEPAAGQTLDPQCNSNSKPRDQFEQVDRRTVVGGDVQYVWPNKQLGQFSESTVGLQTRFDHIGTVGLYETENRVRTATLRQDRVKQLSTGLFVKNETRWLDWFRTDAGLRFDYFNFQTQDIVAASSDVSKAASLVSPKLSAAFGPWKKTEFYANWGTGFHSNDARGVTASVNPASALVRSKGYEIGLRTNLVPTLNSTLTLWKLNLESELLFVGDAGTTQATRPSKRSGVEWTNTWKPKPWLTFDADFTWASPRFSDGVVGANRIPGSPEKVASLGVSVDAIGQWFGGARLRHFGPRPLTEDNSVRSTSNTLTNVRVGYRITKDTQVVLDVFNVFNRKANDIEYFYASRLRGEAGFNAQTTPGDIHFHPSEPRHARLALRVAF
jgi:outer membrane receptor protein involved in Fe transport